MRNGVLDLRDVSEQKVGLSGEWLFLWDSFADTSCLQNEGQVKKLPFTWENSNGYCTYGLKVLFDEPGVYSIFMPPVHSAYRLFINDKLVGEVGKTGTRENSVPATRAAVYDFEVNESSAWIVIQVSNFHFGSGGVWEAPVLGKPSTIKRSYQSGLLKSAFLIGALIVIGLYHLAIFLIRRRELTALFFALMCFQHAIRESFNRETLFFAFWPEVPWEIAIKLLYFTFPLGVIFITLFTYSMFPDLFNKYIRKLVTYSMTGYILLICFSQASLYTSIVAFCFIVLLVSTIHIIFVLAKAAKEKRQGSLLLISGFSILLAAAFNDLLFQEGMVNTSFLLPAAFFVFVLMQALNLALRFSHAYNKAEKLAFNLLESRSAYEKEIEERKKVEKQNEVEAFRSRFYANFTHEFRTPLTLINFNVEQLQKTLKNKELLFTNSIRKHSDSLLHLVNQLLDLGKIHSGKLVENKSVTNLGSFLKSTTDMFYLAAEQKNIRLTYSEENLQGEYLCDADKIEKICNNLLSNAIKYTEEGGCVSLEAKIVETGSKAVLSIHVQDSGIGIPSEDQDKIFDRFYQIKELQNAKHSSSGVGLSLVRELVTFLDGNIHVVSNKGEGSIFKVTLPLEKYDKTEGGEIIRQSAKFPRPSLFEENEKPLVLLVDDQEELLQLLAEEFSEHYRVTTASDGLEAWDCVQEQMPDLVISDVMMPGMDGFELCQRIKNNTSLDHIGVILLTARASTESVLKGLSHAANDYLTKPFNFQELKLRTDNFFKYKALLQEFFQSDLKDVKGSSEKHYVNPFLQKVYGFIEDNLDNGELSVNDLADHMSVSIRTLNRKLSSIIGMSTSEVVKNYRLKKAAEFLKKGSTVAEAAYSTGFDSPSYFGQCFKSQYGVTPSEYPV
ncbi:response regulator [Cytophagaceae bacterium ABcell3]|nr:response regulator [Cytophagaceae bacterium ABcell3]